MIARYLAELAASFSQTLNAMLGGNRDQVLSARAWEAKLAGRWYGSPAVALLDALFFWDPNHCERTYAGDSERTYFSEGEGR